MKRPGLLICLVSAFVTISGIAQTTPVAPAQRPADAAPVDSGPSLAVTMQFIQERLNDIGKLTYIVYSHNTTTGNDVYATHTTDVNNVIADASTCQITYSSETSNSNLTTNFGNGRGLYLPLKDIQDIVVEPIEQYQDRIQAILGSPEWVSTGANPSVTILVVRRPQNVLNPFPFLDAALADRMAKALTHAIELCGGGSKDPF